jgi:hypothetical protein
MERAGDAALRAAEILPVRENPSTRRRRTSKSSRNLAEVGRGKAAGPDLTR